MFIWQGRGGYVLLITFLTLLATNYIADFYGGEGYWESNNWVLGCGLVISGLFVHLLYLKSDHTPRVLVDESTGERLSLVPEHSLWWIPMKFWSIVLSLFGVLAFLK